MKVCVFGAGAVGGHIAARLLRAGGHEVALVARGAHLRAIAADGLVFETGADRFVVRPHALTGHPRELPPQDLVFVTLKAQGQAAAAGDIAALLADGGCAVFASNGIPWWWNHRGPGDPGAPLPLLDPEGALWRRVRPERALGCVVYSANEVVAPGVVRHTANNRWLLGEPDGSDSPRLRAAAQLMDDAGLNTETTADVRGWIWRKLLRNAPLNSVCALTRLAVEELAGDAQLLQLCDAVIDEVGAIAAAHGTGLGEDVERAKAAPRTGAAVDGRRAVGIRPSMLQDVLAGRSLEVEAILGQVQALARESGTPCPRIDALLPLVRGLDRSLRGEGALRA